MNDSDRTPDCGHHREWGEVLTDWETCDECGKTVCFDIDCSNGWKWGDDGALVCFDHDGNDDEIARLQDEIARLRAALAEAELEGQTP